MNIAIIGYGRMGKSIETQALQAGHKVKLVIDLHNQDLMRDLTGYKNEIDVAIEFSVPGIAPDNIIHLLKANIPVVSGTTGWLDRFDEVIDICNNLEGTFFYSSNYSIGVNLFFLINKFAAQLFNGYPDFDLRIEETHHIHKLDAPSGTAITLANHILAKMNRKERWVEPKRFKGSKDLIIESKRKGEVPGTHITQFISDSDEIEIKHIAKDRISFAHGALTAAQFIKDKTGVYGMSDLLGVDL